MIAAVVLAAGASERFGEPKQRILLAPVLEHVRASSVDDVVVVLGAHEVETDAKVVRCNTWARGPGASLRCGLEALAAGAEAAVVVLADGPELSPAAIERVVQASPSGEVKMRPFLPTATNMPSNVSSLPSRRSVKRAG